MDWKGFQEAAPELAKLGRERFRRSGVALLATVRKDGSPRVSPVEPFFIDEHLLVGLMWRSMKALDLLRDARCVIHSAVTTAEGREGEFKLRARGIERFEDRYYQAIRARWEVAPATRVHVFAMDIERASFIAYYIEDAEMIVTQWTAQQGITETRRRYP